MSCYETVCLIIQTFWKKKIRYQKYKRCLAMARMCEERSARYDALQERHDLDWGQRN